MPQEQEIKKGNLPGEDLRQLLSSDPSEQSARRSHRYSPGMHAPLLQLNWPLVHVLPAGDRLEGNLATRGKFEPDISSSILPVNILNTVI